MRHSTGAVRNHEFVAGLLSRNRIIIASCIVLITVLAWGYLFHLDHEMPSSHESMGRLGMTMAAAWTACDFVFTFMMWSVMMVAMMAPAAAPTYLLFSSMSASRNDSRAGGMSLLFVTGHLSVWIGFSALAAMVQWTLHRAASLSPEMSVVNPRIAGTILVAAGLYQLSPLKSSCLKRCQSPLGFILGNWRDGSKGAFKLGLRHGVYCLGCCWALMLVLFVVGVMNLAWVAALATFILVEKLRPAGTWLARAGGVMMIGTGLVVFLNL